jgi:tetratricopeptide (TPR) repeat protein
MKEIKAFVGHSFGKADEQVVGTFLKYFDSIAKSHPSFSWQNAESAEPKILAEKVLERFADKNTFIGICTRNERVIADVSLAPLMLRPRLLYSAKVNFLWKTSDWITQEIGLAVGRGFDVLILLEAGVRQPGGLQGNLEYIPFKREAPEQAFPKILEMLSAMSPKPTGQSAVVANITNDNEETKPQNGDDFKTPTDSWNRDKYQGALFLAISGGDEAQIKVIDEAYRKTSDYLSADNAVTWQACIEYMRISFGKSGQLSRLKNLADSNPKSEDTLVFLARVYSEFQQDEVAAETYLAAMALATTPARKAALARNAARHFQLAKETLRVEETLGQLRQISIETPSVEPALLRSLQDIAEIDKDEEFIVAILERLMELTPDDHSTRFALAYRQSDAGNEAIALHHYLTIPYSERNRVTWNNIGATAEQLALPATSVDSYQRSAELGETLAMSNLGNKFMNVGFIDLAQEQCNRALKLPEPHKNIGTLFSALSSFKEEENERKTEILDGIKTRVSYLQRLGRAATQQTPTDIGENWQGPDCTLKLTRKVDRISLRGTYEREESSLAGLALAVMGSSPATGPVKRKYSIRYYGKLRGRAIIGDMKRERDGASLLESAGGESKIFMMFNDDGTELSIVERANTNSPTVVVLTRVQLLSAHS